MRPDTLHRRLGRLGISGCMRLTRERIRRAGMSVRSPMSTACQRVCRRRGSDLLVLNQSVLPAGRRGMECGTINGRSLLSPSLRLETLSSLPPLSFPETQGCR